MAQMTRFGRKVALPSTRQIRHELLVMMRDEARLNAPAPAAEATPTVAPATRAPFPSN